MGFPQVLKALLKPPALLTRHTAGGSRRAFPNSRHGGYHTDGSARRRSKAQAAQPQPTPSKAIDSSSVEWGTGTAIIPGSEPLLRADHPAPRYPRDRLRATLVARLAHHQHTLQNPPWQPNGELVSMEFTSLILKRVVKGLLHVSCHQDLATSSFLGQIFTGC